MLLRSSSWNSRYLFSLEMTATSKHGFCRRTSTNQRELRIQQSGLTNSSVKHQILRTWLTISPVHYLSALLEIDSRIEMNSMITSSRELQMLQMLSMQPVVQLDGGCSGSLVAPPRILCSSAIPNSTTVVLTHT